jgi:hypothetical protein
VDICSFPEEESQMFRMTRIVPTTVLTLAALALAAPGAQAKLMSGQFGGTAQVSSTLAAPGGPNDVSPIVQSIQAANAEKQSGTAAASSSVQSTQDFNTYDVQGLQRDTGSVVVTTGDMPLANPVQLPTTLSAGLMHASTVHVPVDTISKTPVSVPDSSGNGFDWTAAAIGAGLASLLMLTIGFGVRRRGQLAA